MPRYKITIEYDGTNYAGWQKQIDQMSVQTAIENAIYKFSNHKTAITGSGRTDAEVHALKQVAHFDFIEKFTPFQIMMGINHHLEQNTIAITNCEISKDQFHSRFHAKLRHYQYIIQNRRAKTVLMKNRAWHIGSELNITKMRQAAQHLLGIHDFTSFRASACQAKNAICDLRLIEITQKDDLIIIDISAPSFLQHMVRNIVGTLVLAGKKRISPEQMLEILQAKDRTKSGANAPPYGLYLKQVDY